MEDIAAACPLPAEALPMLDAAAGAPPPAKGLLPEAAPPAKGLPLLLPLSLLLGAPPEAPALVAAENRPGCPG